MGIFRSKLGLIIISLLIFTECISQEKTKLKIYIDADFSNHLEV